MLWAIYCMVYLGSALMVYNIYGFVSFARYVKKLKNWKYDNRILHLPIVLLVLFLLGYLAVGIFGKPDLIVAGILFGGSIFVFVMYRLLNGVTQRIIESEHLEAQLMAAEESNRTKTSFLASISHEMRTPMNVILGLDHMALKDPDLTEETRKHLEIIHHSGQYLLGLINNILDMNRIETGELDLNIQRFSITDALAQINAITQVQCDEKGLTYQTSMTEDTAGCYMGDEMQLKQVLFSILDNAVKYTDAPGTVTFRVESAPTGEKMRELRFSVTDTGVGMSQDFVEKIFQPFSQEDASFTTRHGGSGLSLALAKRKLELMGGSICAESEKNVGATFNVTVPLERVECEKQNRETEEAPETLEDRRILIVDDLEENAEIVADLLELEGAVTERAENGQKALELFEASQPGYFDAVLMDLRMPVMDGLEATRRIRALERQDAKTVPILALTANAFESDVQGSMDAGMNAHLVKPVDADELYGELIRYIKEAYQGREARDA